MTCAVLVTDGGHLLLGHATGSPRWDIPKGLREPGEQPREAAVRELREETGLTVGADDLLDLGVHPYQPRKDLALFVWNVSDMPDPARLTCASTFTARDGRVRPEFDRFAVVAKRDAGRMVGKALASLLVRIGWLGGTTAQG